MKKFTIESMSAGLAIMLLNVVAGAQTPVAVTGTATAALGAIEIRQQLAHRPGM